MKNSQTKVGQKKTFNLQRSTGEHLRDSSEPNIKEQSANCDTLEQVKAYRAAINYVFIQLAGAYPSKFHVFLGKDGNLSIAKQVWLAHLSKDLTPEQIKIGIDVAIAKSDFFPDMSDVRRCAKEYGLPKTLPSPEKAYSEVVNKVHLIMLGQRVLWSHAIVEQAAIETGWLEIRENPRKKIFPLFSRNYQRLVKKLQDTGQKKLASKADSKNHGEKVFEQALKLQKQEIQHQKEKSPEELSDYAIIDGIKAALSEV